MTDSEPLQHYYMSCREYFLKLKKGSFERLFTKYFRFLEKARNGRCMILDVGCGVGQVVNGLGAESVEAIGTDISPVGLRIAQKDRRTGSGAAFVVASGYNLPFRDNVFKVVGCLNVLEHLQQPELCIDEMIRVGKERLIIACPNLLCPVYGRSAREKVGKARKLLVNIISSGAGKKFDHEKPIVGETEETIGRDLDAVTVTTPWNLKRILDARGIKIMHHSSYIGPKNSVDRISRLPLFRSVGGGVFIEGFVQKTTPSGADTSKRA